MSNGSTRFPDLGTSAHLDHALLRRNRDRQAPPSRVTTARTPHYKENHQRTPNNRDLVAHPRHSSPQRSSQAVSLKHQKLGRADLEGRASREGVEGFDRGFPPSKSSTKRPDSPSAPETVDVKVTRERTPWFAHRHDHVPRSKGRGIGLGRSTEALEVLKERIGDIAGRTGHRPKPTPIPSVAPQSASHRHYCLPPFRGGLKHGGVTGKGSKKGYPLHLVFQGRVVGLFDSWAEAQLSLSGYPNNANQGFHSLDDAIDAWQGLCALGMHPHPVDPAILGVAEPAAEMVATEETPKRAESPRMKRACERKVVRGTTAKEEEEQSTPPPPPPKTRQHHRASISRFLGTVWSPVVPHEASTNIKKCSVGGRSPTYCLHETLRGPFFFALDDGE
ncbi:hypothetical protein B0H15DRAFT_807550 [Mycena belliarum]|uniref:Ribonuclease H1 N-terminal domain-containing protein n=1 Tax=Mycena belliarum TaxID=1033014 RepID=A0AAD6TPF4_9AGAR|nr:hypothetical protein B0H15DRAFT_807550 [Mycena belliae]